VRIGAAFQELLHEVRLLFDGSDRAHYARD
jgi:hypothetical protein